MSQALCKTVQKEEEEAGCVRREAIERVAESSWGRRHARRAEVGQGSKTALRARGNRGMNNVSRIL